ncbi:flavin reductase family protein [soil metagenome]
MNSTEANSALQDPDALEDVAAFTSAQLRSTFARFPTGIVAVCGMSDGNLAGMSVSSFVPVSLDPPLVAFCVQNSSTTWPKLAGLDALGISVLGNAQGVAARSLSNKGERFHGLTVHIDDDGAAFLEGSSTWITCHPVQSIPAGDHTIELLEVRAIADQSDVEPLIFHASTFRSLQTEIAMDLDWLSEGWQ